MDPARFPDVPALSKKVKQLLGTSTTLMPNLKPTSIAASDCPSCGGSTNKEEDGKASDGRIDASVATCRACTWKKRIGKYLWAEGVEGYCERILCNLCFALCPCPALLPAEVAPKHAATFRGCAPAMPPPPPRPLPRFPPPARCRRVS